MNICHFKVVQNLIKQRLPGASWSTASVRSISKGLKVGSYVKQDPPGKVERGGERGRPWPGPQSSILRIGQSIT